MKSIWTGDIGFGLVTIPVKLYSAVQDSELNLDMLDKRDHGHIRYKRVNENTGKEVAWEDIVKGYDVDGKYVVLSEKDFENASPENTRRLEITEFLEESAVDTVYFERPYYVEPDKRGVKPYILFREALKKSKKAALCTFVLRNKEHLGLLKVRGDVIVLNQLRFEEEIRSTADLNIPAKENVPANQLKMANTLIGEMTGDFDLGQYKDTYSTKLLKYIKQKAKGGKAKPARMKVLRKGTDDLMEQLKASLETKRKKTS